MKIRGTALTLAQRKILLRNGFTEKNVDQYLLKKRRQVEDGNKHLSREGDKQEQWVLIHKDTGDIKEIVLQEVS